MWHLRRKTFTFCKKQVFRASDSNAGGAVLRCLETFRCVLLSSSHKMEENPID